MKNYKKIIFIGLIAILSNAIVASDDQQRLEQQRLEEIYKLYDAGQVITSKSTAVDVEILNKEIKRLTDQKSFLQGSYNKYITPTLYGAEGLFLVGFQIICIKLHIESFTVKRGNNNRFYYFKKLIRALIYGERKGDFNEFIRLHAITTIPVFLIPSIKRIFNTTWNYKQKIAKKIQKIDTEITRNRAIIAYLCNKNNHKKIIQ